MGSGQQQIDIQQLTQGCLVGTRLRHQVSCHPPYLILVHTSTSSSSSIPPDSWRSIRCHPEPLYLSTSRLVPCSAGINCPGSLGPGNRQRALESRQDGLDGHDGWMGTALPSAQPQPPQPRSLRVEGGGVNPSHPSSPRSPRLSGRSLHMPKAHPPAATRAARQ